MRRRQLPYWAIFLIVWTGLCLAPIAVTGLIALAYSAPPGCSEACGLQWALPAVVTEIAVPIWLLVAIPGVWLSRRRLPRRSRDAPPRQRP